MKSPENNDEPHASKTFRWCANAWTSEPGANSTPLSPSGDGVVKTLPAPSVPVFCDALPPLQDDVTEVNKTFLEVSGGLKNNKWMALLPGVIGMPLTFVGAGVLLWAMFADGFSESLGIKLAILALLPVVLFMAYSLFTIAVFSPKDEPIRFSRKDKKIYRYQARRTRLLDMDVYHPSKKIHVEIYDWENCRAEVVRKVISSGSSARRDCFLELAILDPSSQQVVKRFRVGDRDVYGDFSFRVFLWETIRRYMEQGDEHVPPPALQAHRETLLDCIEEFNPFSLPAKSAPGAQHAISYILATVLWIVLIPTVFIILSRWLDFKISRKVDWGRFEESVFHIDENDPARQRTLRPELEAPAIWRAELQRRRQAAWLWLASLLSQLGIVWWVFFTPRYYQ